MKQEFRQAARLIELLRYLAARPSPDEACNHLVLSWKGHFPIQQAALGTVTQEGAVAFVGRFGYDPKVLNAYETTTIWDEIPTSLAIREQRLVVCANAEEIADQFPHIANAMPDLACLMPAPLISRETTIGVCVVSGTSPLTEPDDSETVMSEIALVFTLYVAGILPRESSNDLRHDQDSHHSVGAKRVTNRQIIVPHQLTKRQVKVLKLIAEGFTNRHIAMRIGYSESTVRQDTMAIYAYLGVGNRAEAIQSAQQRGIVS